MLFHFRWNINVVNPGLGDTLFRWGGTGVDLFFLISGFVITLSASRVPNGLNGAISFIKRRALRILPAYYIILLITFFLSGA
ncbi:acyltransferase family protein, partial [Peribacillus sp. SIMBA_075]|uniref:acyltransferase family protein n=1 Tax=Peribacillus sp. SIMBA_075 TaxID=3085813 RepID=UPI00397C644B